MPTSQTSNTKKPPQPVESGAQWSPGDIIKKRRGELDWTQKQLAERIGVSDAYISTLETGEKLPTYANALALAQELGIEAEDFWKKTRQLHETRALQKISASEKRLGQGQAFSTQNLPPAPPWLSQLVTNAQDDPKLATAMRNLARVAQDPKRKEQIFQLLQDYANLVK